MAQQAEKQSWAKGVGPITLFIDDKDMAATIQFYRDVFNLAVVFADDNSTVFKMGATILNLLKQTAVGELIAPAPIPLREAGSRAVFTIEVDDVDAVCAELTAQGVALLNGPINRPWGIRTASFIDPGGHIWELAMQAR